MKAGRRHDYHEAVRLNRVAIALCAESNEQTGKDLLVERAHDQLGSIDTVDDVVQVWVGRLIPVTARGPTGAPPSCTRIVLTLVS